MHPALIASDSIADLPQGAFESWVQVLFIVSAGALLLKNLYDRFFPRVQARDITGTLTTRKASDFVTLDTHDRDIQRIELRIDRTEKKIGENLSEIKDLVKSLSHDIKAENDKDETRRKELYHRLNQHGERITRIEATHDTRPINPGH